MRYVSLCENHLFAKTYSGGKKKSGRTVTVYILSDRKAYKLAKDNPEKKKINRVGITVSKKHGGAVQRNREKRIIREAYRQIDSEYDLKKGKLIVIVGRVGVAGKKSANVKSDLLYCFRFLGMINEASL